MKRNVSHWNSVFLAITKLNLKAPKIMDIMPNIQAERPVTAGRKALMKGGRSHGCGSGNAGHRFDVRGFKPQ